MYKYLIDVQNYHFVVASIPVVSSERMTDTCESHFSFAVFDVEPEDFAEAIDKLLEIRDDPDRYRNETEIVLKTSRFHDTIRLTLHCGSASITRGNLKVLCTGSIDRLRGLPKALRKVVNNKE